MFGVIGQARRLLVLKTIFLALSRESAATKHSVVKALSIARHRLQNSHEGLGHILRRAQRRFIFWRDALLGGELAEMGHFSGLAVVARPVARALNGCGGDGFGVSKHRRHRGLDKPGTRPRRRYPIPFVSGAGTPGRTSRIDRSSTSQAAQLCCSSCSARDSRLWDESQRGG